MATSTERLSIKRKMLIFPGRGRGSSAGTRGFEHTNIHMYEPLIEDLGRANVETVVFDINWRNGFPQFEALQRIQELRRTDNPQETVRVALLGTDWGGVDVYKLGAADGVDRVVTVSARINPIRNLLPAEQHLLDTRPGQFQHMRTAPLRRGTKLLSILQSNDPYVSIAEGTFLNHDLVTTVVHPFTGSHYAGVEAILSDPARRREIVSFVTPESDNTGTN